MSAEGPRAWEADHGVWLAHRRLGVETGLWLAWGIVTAAYLPAVLSAAFLSDGAAILWTVHQWNASHELWARIGELFVGRLPTGNNYYRPLPFASFALDFAVYGSQARGWRITSVIWHLVAIAGVYGLAVRLAAAPPRKAHPADHARGRAYALFAALMFGLSPAGPEVVIWVAGRYDAIATAAVFVSLYALACSTTGIDRAAVASWIAAIVALLSKESAAVIGPVSALIALRAAWAAHPHFRAPLARGFLRRWVPFVAIFAGYVVWREQVFGSALRVYASDRLVWNVDLAATLDSIRAWYDGLVPGTALRRLLTLLAVATLATAAWRARARAGVAQALVIVLAAAVISIGLVLPHKPVFAATGEDARLFYTASGFIALALASAVLPTGTRTSTALGFALVLATTASGTIALEHNVREWASAARGMQALLRDLELRAAAMGVGDYGFVLVPDHIGPVPFGRNAQGALVLPPFQSAALSGRLVPMIPDDLAGWYAKLERGVVPALQTLPLTDVVSSLPLHPVLPRPGAFTPSRYFCWNNASQALVPVPGIDASTVERWLASWRRGLVRAGCPDLARAVPSRVTR